MVPKARCSDLDSPNWLGRCKFGYFRRSDRALRAGGEPASLRKPRAPALISLTAARWSHYTVQNTATSDEAEIRRNRLHLENSTNQQIRWGRPAWRRRRGLGGSAELHRRRGSEF